MSSQSVSPHAPGTTWEYRVIDDVTGSDEESLNDLGAEGWELVGVSTSTERVRLYFKRPALSFRERITLDQRRHYVPDGNSIGRTTNMRSRED